MNESIDEQMAKMPRAELEAICEKAVARLFPRSESIYPKKGFTHEIKIAPQYFCRVADGSKTFEVRNNDRGYQPGDMVVLKEFDKARLPKLDNGGKTLVEEELQAGYTGRTLVRRIGYVLPINGSQVVFSLLDKGTLPETLDA